MEIPAELTSAIATMTEALAARHQLDDLAAEMKVRRAAVVAAQEKAAASFEELETDLALAGASASKDLKKRHEAARGGAQEADLAAKRHIRIESALPAKLVEADEAIETANAALQPALGAFRETVASEFADELAAAAQALVKVMSRGFALSQGLGLPLHLHLSDIAIPNCARRAGPLIADSRLYDRCGVATDLRSAWQDIPDLAALCAELQPLSRVAVQAEAAIRRLTNQRLAAEITEQDARRRGAPAMRHSTLPIKPSPTPTVPSAKFQPSRNSRTAPRSHAALEPFGHVAASSDPDAMAAYDDAIRRSEAHQ